MFFGYLRKRILTVILIAGLLLPLFQTPTASAATVDSGKIGIYLDQPFVQGSYASTASTLTESFDDYVMDESNIRSCNGDENFNGGLIRGTCSIMDGNELLSASTTSSTQTTGGPISKFITGYPNDHYEFDFYSSKKYIGFWWATGSTSNSVTFYSNDYPVATLNVSDVFNAIGPSPAPEDYEANASIISAIDNTPYQTKLYFGNPRSYPAVSPPPSTYPQDVNAGGREPYVYIHAFAGEGVYFNKVAFSGSGFEIDNLTTSNDSVSIDNRLVEVSQISADAEYVALPKHVLTYIANNGDSNSTNQFAFGDSIEIFNNPKRVGYTFLGWRNDHDGSIQKYLDVYTPPDSNVNLTAQWIAFSAINPARGHDNVWLNLQGEYLRQDLDHPLTPGYQSVYFIGENFDGSWVGPSAQTVISSVVTHSGNTSIDVQIPSGYKRYKFWIDACANYSAPASGECFSLHPDVVYTVAYTLNYSADSNGSISGSASQSIDVGANGVAVSAVANSGYHFVKWSDNSTSNPRTDINVVSDLSVTATFAKNQGGGGGGGGTPPPVDQIIPEVFWNPQDMYEGDKVSDLQLNATFSTPGTVVYSIPDGFIPAAGEFVITAQFTPFDQVHFKSISVARTIKVLAKNSDNQKTKSQKLKKIGVIYFNTNEYFLDAKDRKKLKDYFEIITKNPEYKVFINGHTDIRKGLDNILLSQNRARAVTKYFVYLGLKYKIIQEWYGPSRPAAPGIDKISYAKNRRVEIFQLLPSD